MASTPNIVKYSDLLDLEFDVKNKFKSMKGNVMVVWQIEYRFDGRVLNVQLYNLTNELVTDHDPGQIVKWIKGGQLMRSRVA